MDKATFLGFGAACGLCFWCMWSGSNGQMGMYWSAAALVLVLFGSAACTMMSLPLPTFIDSWRIVRKVFFCKEVRLEKVVQQMVDLASTARQEGLLALENEIVDIEDPFLAEGLRLVIDGQSPEEVEISLRLTLHGMSARHKKGKKVFQVLGVYSPAYGLLTTIIGQVVMFKNMGTDVGAIGAGMAVALLGTLYGSLFSNLVCLPFADKLEARAAQEALVKELYLQGIVAIAEENSPTILKQKLLAFLDSKTAALAEASV